jgi:hypothetical protein
LFVEKREKIEKIMSQLNNSRFLEYVQAQETLNEDQVKACVFMHEETHSVILQLIRAFQNSAVLTVTSASVCIYKLMRVSHRFSEFTGEDKKEVVVHTILGAFAASGVDMDRTSQALMEQVIDLIWWASHSAKFAVKKACFKCMGRKPIRPVNPISVASLHAVSVASPIDDVTTPADTAAIKFNEMAV